MKTDPRILLIRPSALGDVLRTVPLAASIRAAYPNCVLDWVVQKGFEDAIRAHPAVNDVIAFPRRELRHWWRSPATARQTWRFFRGLRRGYDLAIDAQGLGRSGLMLLASGATRRIGFSKAREFGWVGANVRLPIDPGSNAVDRMLALIEKSGIPVVKDMSLHAPADADQAWQTLKCRLDIGDNYVVLAPTSRWDSKAWPEDNWADLARHLLGRGLDRVVLLGAPNEREVLERIVKASPAGVESLAGEATVGMSMAAVRDGRLLVANDSAMLHAAVGFNVPMVGLFGPTDPEESGPYGHVRDTLRSAEAVASGAHYRDRGLGDRLMRGITVEEVCEAADERLGRTATPHESGGAR